MAELTLKLHIDPKTGKKTIVADYHSDADALPNEHEEEHRRLVKKLVEGASLEGGDLVVDREAEDAPAMDEEERQGEREGALQKD
jgi:hypothetical protein